ncbi:hypothetical protein BASA81_004033 [Batrachochytrium salamandrivorans]|nr:hypothetical protein BASA81_004033 [Batrachochytrium salamandrivorans]
MPDGLVAEYTAAGKDVLLFIKAPFVAPATTSPVDFDATFGGALPPQARELLQLATLQRAKLADVLGDKNLDVRNLIAAVDAYLPSLWQLTASLQAQEASLKLVRKLEFKWTSALSNKPKELVVGHTLLFETSFVLTIRALAHRDAAQIALESNPEDFAQISKELRTGAGIFDFLANDLLARVGNGEAGERPLEMNRLVMASLGALFLADAQRVAIAKALHTNASPSVVAKLLLGAAERYEFSARCITQINKPSFDLLIPGLLEELGALPAILRACAANALAQMHWLRGEYAIGLTFAQDATHRLEIIRMGKGLQQSELQRHLVAATGRARGLENEYMRDCSLVYFIKPADSHQIQVPSGSFVMDPIAYELPLAEIVSFVAVPGGAGPSSSTENRSVQSFWSSLWAKPVDSSSLGKEETVSASQVSGAKGGHLPSTLQPELPSPILSSTQSAAIPTPAGMDPGVFASLPLDIQREIASGQQQ